MSRGFFPGMLRLAAWAGVLPPLLVGAAGAPSSPPEACASPEACAAPLPPGPQGPHGEGVAQDAGQDALPTMLVQTRAGRLLNTGEASGGAQEAGDRAAAKSDHTAASVGRSAAADGHTAAAAATATDHLAASSTATAASKAFQNSTSDRKVGFEETLGPFALKPAELWSLLKSALEDSSSNGIWPVIFSSVSGRVVEGGNLTQDLFNSGLKVVFEVKNTEADGELTYSANSDIFTGTSTVRVEPASGDPSKSILLWSGTYDDLSWWSPTYWGLKLYNLAFFPLLERNIRDYEHQS